jgi:putative transposase
VTYDPERHHRRSIRYRGYNYTSAGAYFVTVCVEDRACAFGEVVGCEARLTDVGYVVAVTWETLPERFPTIDIDSFVVVPNHVHGIVFVGARFIAPIAPSSEGHLDSHPAAVVRTTIDRVALQKGAMNRAPTNPANPALGEIVRTFKAVSTRLIRTSCDPSFAWQRNYYERIVRNDPELDRIRAYIANNPTNWHEDDENPDIARS